MTTNTSVFSSGAPLKVAFKIFKICAWLWLFVPKSVNNNPELLTLTSFLKITVGYALALIFSSFLKRFNIFQSSKISYSNTVLRFFAISYVILSTAVRCIIGMIFRNLRISQFMLILQLYWKVKQTFCGWSCRRVNFKNVF